MGTTKSSHQRMRPRLQWPLRLANSTRLCCFPRIALQQTTQPLVANDSVIRHIVIQVWRSAPTDEPVPKFLMRPFRMIVLHRFVEQVLQMRSPFMPSSSSLNNNVWSTTGRPTVNGASLPSIYQKNAQFVLTRLSKFRRPRTFDPLVNSLREHAKVRKPLRSDPE